MSNQTFKTLLVASFMTLFVLPLMAQQATIKGQLFNDEDGTTLPFATIIVGDTGAGTTTDFDGNYELQLDAGTHTITFEYIGLTAKTETVTLSAGEMRDLSVRLGESAELLEQVVVTANKSGVKIGESTVSIAVVKPDLLNNTNSDSDEIVQKVPGVNVIDGQANIRGGSGYSYGAGSRVLLLVDDLPFLAGDAGFPNWSDIPIENTGQVEVLKGAASSLYGSSAMNGIINFKTAYPTSESYTRISLYNTNFFAPREEIFTNDEGEEQNRQWWATDDSRREVFFENDSITLKKPGNRGLQFAHRQKFGKFDLVLGGVLYDNQGFRQFERDNKARLNFNTRYRITDKFSIGVNGNINRGSSVSYFLWQNPDEGTYQSFSRIEGEAGSILDQLGLNGFSTTTSSNTFRYNIDPFLTIFDEKGNRHKILSRYYHIGNDNGNNQANFSDLLYGEYQFNREFKGSGINLVAGALGQVTFSEAQLYGNANYTSSNVGAYAQMDKRFADKLTVSVGARYEMNTIISPDSISSTCHTSDTNPRGRIANPETKYQEAKPVFRAGINYQPAEYTYLRASWGQGYRFPTIAERYISTDVGDLLFICPNPELQSETGWSSEIGVRQGVKISSWQGFLDLSYFWTEYQDMMEFTFGGANPDPDNPLEGFQSGNIDDTRIRGAEISFMGRGDLFGVPTNLIAGYTYIDPQYKNFTDQTRMNSTSDENVLKYRFKHTAKIDIESTIKKRISVGASLQYNSKMEALDIYFYDLGKFLLPEFIPGREDILGVEAFRNRNDKGSAILDFRLAYNISDVAKISFILKNATNQSYTLRPALMEAPMNLTVRADVTFRGKVKN